MTGSTIVSNSWQILCISSLPISFACSAQQELAFAHHQAYPRKHIMSAPTKMNRQSVVDLVEVVTPTNKRYSRKNNNENINPFRRIRRSPRNKNDGGEKATPQKKANREVIELDCDSDLTQPTSDAAVAQPRRRKQQSTSLNNDMSTGRKRRRSRSIQSIDSDEVEILDVFSPPPVAAAASRPASTVAVAAAPSKKRTHTSHIYEIDDKPPVDRIREVFPLVSRSRVEELLTMAKSYSSKGDDEELIQLVMTGLADDPTGKTCTEAVFAAAAVGGRLDNAADDNNHAADETGGGTGRQKVAQLECQCCFAEYDFEEMVSCRTQGHLFCKTCLQRHTEQRVFGLGSFGNKGGEKVKSCEIICMHASGCTSGFQEGQLRKALSTKVNNNSFGCDGGEV